MSLREPPATLYGVPPSFPGIGPGNSVSFSIGQLLPLSLGRLTVLSLTGRLGATVLQAQEWVGKRKTGTGFLPY